MEVITTKATPAAERQGDWMQLASGRQFWPFDPRPEEIEIGDIAVALAKICRFGGHCHGFYSVAEHSVRVSRVCEPADALWGLLHDAPEAYLGDLPRPIKRHPAMAAYRAAEEALWFAICARFGLSHPEYLCYDLPGSVRRADEILLATEARDLMGNHCRERWSSIRDIEPLPVTIEPWHQDAAARLFLTRFRELTSDGRKSGFVREKPHSVSTEPALFDESEDPDLSGCAG